MSNHIYASCTRTLKNVVDLPAFAIANDRMCEVVAFITIAAIVLLGIISLTICVFYCSTRRG